MGNSASSSSSQSTGSSNGTIMSKNDQQHGVERFNYADTTTATSAGGVTTIVSEEAPPKLKQSQSLEQRFYDKFMKQPLVPIGCGMTAYFLASGIRSFKNRDPRRAQKMMRARVGAQFFTLVAFVGYVGLDSFNFEVAPAYQRRKKLEKLEEELQHQGQGQGQPEQQHREREHHK